MRRTPLQERSSDTVSSILDAAAVLLTRLPLDHLTTSRIALEAGVSVGALYRFFPDKQAIIDAIAIRRVEEFQQVVESRLSQLESLSGPALLNLMIDAYVEFLGDHPDFRTIALGRHVSALTREQHTGQGAGPAELVKMFLPDDDEKGIELKLRVAIETGERLIDFAFSQPSKEDRNRVIEEMKRILSGYLFGGGL
jgi:AcrR family transcriptional regulator